MEQLLRSHREQAMKFLKENRAQSREGIELLTRDHLAAIVAAATGDRQPVTPEQVEAVYREVLNLSYVMFSLGYSLAKTGDQR